VKANVESWRVLFAKIDDAIEHSRTEGLPLESISLYPEEWDMFVRAFKEFKVPRSLLNHSLESTMRHSNTMYRQIRIYKEQ